MRWLRLRQGPAVAGLVLLAAALLAGCGAPQYTYVKNSADHMYVKIPASWHSIAQKDLDDAIGLDPAESASSRGLWLQGYDAADTPSAVHLFGSSATVSSSSPRCCSRKARPSSAIPASSRSCGSRRC